MKIFNIIWRYIKDVFPFFLVGAIITAMYLLFCCSCSTVRPINKGNLHEYHIELQHYYQHQQK